VMSFQQMATRGCESHSRLALFYAISLTCSEHSDGDNVCVSAFVALAELIEISSVDLVELCQISNACT
jgi:hypothetical protein